MGLKLSNSQFNSIMNEYSFLRDEAEERINSHKEIAYKTLPQLQTLDQDFLLAISTLKSQPLKDKIDEINQKRRNILSEGGFPPDYLVKKYQCEACKDTGFIENEPCQCYRAKVIKLLYGSGKWQNLFGSQNFDTFNLDFYEPGKEREMAEAGLNRAKSFSKNLLNPTSDIHKNLLITGKTGTGKTFLCNAIAKELIENNVFVVYFTAPSLFELFEKNTFRKDGDEADFSAELNDLNVSYSNLFDCDLLIIDDLGTEFSNSFTNAKFFNLINQRLIMGLPTLISTNHDMMQLNKKYSERLTSRISGEFSLIQLMGDDIRSKKRILKALKST